MNERRKVLGVLGGAALGALGACGGARAQGAGAREGHEGHEEGEEGITAPEDLMREHGVLRRVFQVYDEAARRLRAGEPADPQVVLRGARLVRAFGEDYHERAEERFVFPPLRNVPAQAPLVAVLLAQHARGREVTDAVLVLAGQGPAAPEARARLAGLLDGFVRMYRAHAAREDTVLFPALRATLGRHAIDELGERMEETEHATVGEGGFERAVVEVAALEQALGIEDLARFTPPRPEGA